MNWFVTSALTTAVIATLGTANAAAWSCPSRSGSRPFGPTHAVAVVGDLGLISSGALIEIVELGDSEALAPIAEVAFEKVIVAIAVGPFADRLYVADGDGVTAVDISDPTEPRLLGRYAAAGKLRDVAETGGLVFLADEDLGLRIVDFSDPATPVELGALPSPGLAWGVAVAMPYAYLADFAGGLRVIDVSVPSAPAEAGEYRPTDAPYVLDVALAGDVAVVTVWDGSGGSLRTLDLSDPTAPQELGVYPLIDGPTALAVVGSTAWVAESYYGGVHEVDVTDPAAPVRTNWGIPHTDDDVTSLAATDEWLIGGMPGIGAIVRDRTTTSGAWDGWFETVGTVRAIAVAGDRIYAGGGGMRIVDAADPHDLVELGAWEDSENGKPVYGQVRAVAATADYAYLAWSHAGAGSRVPGLVVIDTSQAGAPVELVSNPTLDEPQDLVLVGDLLLLVAGGLEVLDVSQPVEPLTIGSVPLAGAVKVAVARDLALITQRTLWGADEEALAVVDISTPAAPVLLATLPLPCPPSDVTAAGAYAFVGCATSGVMAVDLATPAAPAQVGWLDRPAAVNVGALAVSGRLLYVLEGDGGGGAAWLRVVDVADPTAMRSVGIAATGGNARDLAIVGRRVAVANGSRGVSLFDPMVCFSGLARQPSSPD